MSEKIRDGVTGGTYNTGIEFEMFAPTGDRLGVTGKFNLLVDEVGQITSLNTTNKSSIINSINEVNTNANASVKLNSSPQTLVGSYTFGNAVGTSNNVMFKHDVEFQGSVRFTGGAGDTLDLSNTFIALGDDTSLTPVGDGGLILQRANNIPDARIFWDESENEWKMKPGTALSYGVLHKGNVNATALPYILTGDLNAGDLELISNAPFLRTRKSNGTSNGKVWSFNNSTTNDDLQIRGLSDNFATPYQAYTINRTSGSITGHQFFTNELERLKIDNTNVTSTLPILVNTISERTLNNGVLVDSLIIKDEGILNGANRLVSYLNSGSIFNPTSANLDFTINGQGTEALFIDASSTQIFNRYNTYLDQGLFVDTINQRNSNGITFNHLAKFNANINISKSNPKIVLNATDQGVDSKNWEVYSTSGTFRISSNNDASNALKQAYSIGRTGNSIVSHSWNIGDNVNLLLQGTTLTVGDTVNDANQQITLQSKVGFNTSVVFRQSDGVKGSIGYSDSTNRFNISRNADVGGGLLGGIFISETDVLVDNLTLRVETSLEANTINPYSGNLTAFGQNVNITGILSTNSDKLVFGSFASQDDRIEFDEASNEFRFFEGNDISNSSIKTGNIQLFSSSAPLNTKTTAIDVFNSGAFVIFNISDDGATTNNLYTILKTGISPTSHNFYIGDVIETKISNGVYEFGNGTNDNATTIKLVSKDAFNNVLTFTQAGDALKGDIGYIDSTNVFSINRYANSGGSLLGGIRLHETRISVDTLPLETPASLKTNNILELTNNNGVDIDGVLIKDGSINLGTGNAIQSIGDVNIVLDSDNNATTNFNIYSNFINSTNRLFGITELGTTTINSVSGGDILSIVDANATSAVLANPIISFDYSNGVGGAITRAGYIGFGTTSNDSLYVLNDTGSIILSGTNITLDANNLDLNTVITTSNKNINIGSGSLTMGLSGLYFDTGDIVLKQNTSGANTIRFQSSGGMVFNIDDDNNNTGKDFQWRHNGVGYGGSPLMQLDDTGILSLYGRLDTRNNDIHVGTGNLSFASLNSDYISFNDSTNEFAFVADGATASSKIAVGTVDTNTVNTATILSSNGQVISTWCTFNGTGTPQIIDSYNISSITDNGVGDYTLNFTNPLPANYCVSVCGDFSGGIYQVASPATTSVRIRARSFDGNLFNLGDPTRIYVTINCKQ
jgi:hypothetical protein